MCCNTVRPVIGKKQHAAVLRSCMAVILNVPAVVARNALSDVGDSYFIEILKAVQIQH